MLLILFIYLSLMQPKLGLVFLPPSLKNTKKIELFLLMLEIWLQSLQCKTLNTIHIFSVCSLMHFTLDGISLVPTSSKSFFWSETTTRIDMAQLQEEFASSTFKSSLPSISSQCVVAGLGTLHIHRCL